MQTLEQTKEILSNKESRSGMFLMLSSILFILICVISLFLFFGNMFMTRTIEANKNEVAEYMSSIEKIKTDSNIVRAELVANNKDALVATIQKNKAQKYITELRNISAKYQMMFSWFSYSNGHITTAAVAVPERTLAWEDGIKKITNFIQDYRNDNKFIFQLAPILSISGYEQRRMFSIEFNIAPISDGISQK